MRHQYIIDLKFYIRKIVREDVNWLELNHVESVVWHTFMVTVINLQVPYHEGIS
jgi:hypothetical protein